jgi:hypothetical protein
MLAWRPDAAQGHVWQMWFREIADARQKHLTSAAGVLAARFADFGRWLGKHHGDRVEHHGDRFGRGGGSTG